MKESYEIAPFARAEKMKSDAPLDYAVFRLSPKRSRCDLFVSSSGSTEKIASGLIKPFVAHLKVAEEQVTSSAQSVKLEVGQRKDKEEWFTKGTLERFVRFVSTPEVLELVNTCDAEMSQLEAARRIYSQGSGDQLSGSTAADDATKKELLRAIDVRLVAVQQDLLAATARAAAAGFNLETISELQMFADKFGAHRLNEACVKFISLTEKRPHLFSQWRSVGPEDGAVRSSYGSGMSIESDPPSPPPPRQEPISSQQANPQPFTFPLRRTLSRDSSVERDAGVKQDSVVGEEDKKDGSSASGQTESIQASQPARRLSVQDRINLFENKQKESSGGNPVVTKSVELRRMASDVSTAGTAAEKAVVLRRWSGASDMSIDLSAEKRDTESPQYTPSSSALPQEGKILSQNDDPSENYAILKPEVRIIPSLRKGSDARLKEASSSNMLEPNFEFSKSNFNLVPGESDDSLTDQVRGKVQSRDSLKLQLLGKARSMNDLRVQAVGMTQLGDDLKELRSSVSRTDNHENSEESFKLSFSGKSYNDALYGDQGRLKASQIGEDPNNLRYQIARTKDQDSSVTQIRTIASNGGTQSGVSNQREDSESGDTSVVQVSSKPIRRSLGESEVLGGTSGSRIREAFAARSKVNDCNSLLVQQDARSVEGTETVGERDSNDFVKPFSASISGIKDSGPQRMKSNKQGSVVELSKKIKVRRDANFLSRNTKIPSSQKVTADAPEGSGSLPTPTPEQSERVKLSKGNQDMNDELRMKANELEKLFAEHKLRIPGDQSNSGRKAKPDQMHAEPSTSLSDSKSIQDISPQLSDYSKPSDPTGNSKKKTKFSSNLPDNQNCVDALNKNFSELSVSEGSRGKLYDEYIQKRDAKLREDWSSNRAEKEATLKYLQDSLERNRFEMKAKFAGSADIKDSISSIRRRAERLRSYNNRSITKMVQPPLNFEDSEYDDVDRAMDDISFGDGSARGEQGKKSTSNTRNLPSSTSRGAAIPKSASKASAHTAKQRMQLENPLAQSVPNFSDFRKENTRPSSGSKATRSQVRNSVRSKTTSEEPVVIKEDKSRRLAPLKKTAANDCGEVSQLDSEGVTLTPMKFDEEVQKSIVTKTFLKQGSRASYVSQAVIARSKASAGSEPVKNIDENNEIESGPDEFGSNVKAEGQSFETLKTEADSPLEDGEPVLMLDLEKFTNSGSENGDSDLTISRTNPALHSKLPSEITSSFQPGYPVQEWPGESPISWNSHSQHPFSYQHEMSDVDASVDSPVGSPASWNSNSLNQMETDAARMRKKWGAAQKPVLAAPSINNSSRKDMTRGFKRLLKFGRKNRGSEGLVDWISATTSEGDDDTEDGRDPANRSSEDLRKSRMGFSHAQPSDDGFTESEFFNESVQSSQSSKLREDHASGSSVKAPRSFFSLSSFMSKGSESKPR